MIVEATDRSLPVYVRRAARKACKPFVALIPGCYQLLTQAEADEYRRNLT